MSKRKVKRRAAGRQQQPAAGQSKAPPAARPAKAQAAGGPTLALNALLPDRADRAAYGLRLLLCLAALYVAVMTAWVADVGQVSFRQVWNFIQGDGITFNVGERLQAFTHPSWFLLLSGVAAVTRELFMTTLLLSMALSLAAIALLLAAERRACPGRLPLLTPALLLVFSRAFCDYLASGLEHPLSFFLVGLLLWLVAADRQLARQPLSWPGAGQPPAAEAGPDRGRQHQGMFALLALLVLNRLDLALLFLPLAGLLTLRILAAGGWRRLLRAAWPGAALLLLWFAFAFLYFGSPLPNTHQAHLSAGLPLAALLEKGAAYFAVALQRDPISLVIILAGLAASWLSRDRALLALAAGQLLYLVYVLQAGGDFMEGRLFAVPVFLAVGQLTLAFAGMARPRRAALGTPGLALAGLLALALLLGGLGRFPFLTARDYNDRAFIGDVADERGFYYLQSGLMSRHRQGWPQIQAQPEQPPTAYSLIRPGLGAVSLAGPETYLVSPYGLSSPFIARLPAIQGCAKVLAYAQDPGKGEFTHCQRVGHFMRRVPEGFGEYVTGRAQSLPDARLNPLLQDLALAARGPLFTRARLAALWRLNTGHHDAALARGE